MRIHREGYGIILGISLILALILTLVYLFAPIPWLLVLLEIAALGFWLFVVQFFRNPRRRIQLDEGKIYAPADGKVVVIEETHEPEYFKDRRIQISIFMSPLNVHANRNPVSGEIIYQQYHPGKYLVAWHPKSSTENERNTLVYQAPQGNELLVRQIAGAVARRIISYVQTGQPVEQGQEFGFIKFGSRLDILLPRDAQVKVNIGDSTRAGLTLLAEWN